MEQGIGAQIAVELGGEVAQAVVAHQLRAGKVGSQDRERREPALDRSQMLRVQVLPRLEPGIGDLVGQQPVHHHRVDAVTEQPQVGGRAARLGYHHRLGVHHQPDAGAGSVGQQGPDPVEPLVEAGGRGKDLVACDGERSQAREHGTHDPRHRALQREDPVHVPGQDIREREKPHGLRRRCAVDNQNVPRPRVGVLFDLGQGEELVQAGQDRELLGLDAVETAPAEQFDEISADRSPGVLEALGGVDLLRPQALGHRGRVRSQGAGEGVGQGVGGVGRHHDGAQSGVGAPQRGGRGDGRLAHAALAGEEQRPHAADSTLSLRLRKAVPMIRPSARRLTNPGMGTRSSATR